MPLFSRRALALQLRSWKAASDGILAGIAHRVTGAPAPTRWLLLSDEAAYTSEQQFAPLWRHAAALRRRFGLVLRHRPLSWGLAQRRFDGIDVVGLKLGFRTPAAEARRVVARVREAAQASGTRVVYFDGDDDLCIQWPEALRLSDVYLKKHVFADPSNYERRYLGKSNLTDFVSREFGRSFEDNEIPSSGPIDRTDLPKLRLGWNIGLDDKIAALAGEIGVVPHEAKDIDIGSRAFVPPEVWIHPLRAPVVERLAEIDGRFRVLAPRDRVSQAQYYDEMRRARICVSPFGYGELCWRDFEAVLCGCLLVKPDMGHARTWPDIFVDGETCAAVRWDYADLESVCARYLADEGLRRQVADRARQVLLEALGEAAFVDRFGELLRRVRANA